jgi:thioredoxin reductase
MHDLIVIGGGPAGLTATMYAIQKRLDVLLITRDLGGKTNWRMQLPFIERHMVINGDEVVSRFVREHEYLSEYYRLDAVDGIEPVEGGYKVTLSSGETLSARALIIATGADGLLLDVPGEKEFIMRGVALSAISYAQVFIDRQVAVVGAGDLGLRAALLLGDNAEKVTLIAPGGDHLDTPAGKKVQARENIEILLDASVEAIEGDQYARRIIVTKGDERHSIEVDAVFIELGLNPRSELVAGLVERDEDYRIIVDAQTATSRAGIFAAGDVTNSHAEQVLIAIGEGAKAALSAYEYLLTVE